MPSNAPAKSALRGVKRTRARSAEKSARPAKRHCTSANRSRSVGAGAKPLRIGILLTYPKLEVKKEELINYYSSYRPWMKLAEKSFIKERKFRRERKLNGKRHPLGKTAVPSDYAVGLYIKHAYEKAGKNVEVDMIMPHEISVQRLKSNDLNFFLIYDALESFHTDKTPGKKLYHKLVECMDKCDNIFPPKEYQEFIGSKIAYYNYLNENGISIAPTVTMTREEYKKLGGAKAAAAHILNHAQEAGWKRFICKPVLGQEAIDAKFFTLEQKPHLTRYFERCMKKYPGIVIQKEIKDFGNSKKCPEIRMYYVGNKYQYSISAQENSILRPREEGGTFDTPIGSLKRHSRKILKRLPEMIMPNGKKLPRLLTRLDLGYIVNGAYSPFVNEVEYVPSLYSEDAAHHPDRLIDARLGDQMVKITKLYVK